MVGTKNNPSWLIDNRLWFSTIKTIIIKDTNFVKY